ncbi:MAG: hypothetical protein NVS4B1_18300 [Ktedonobacteraceae bacterium]
MKRVAVFRALQLGDLLVAVPAFRALRGRFPDAEITLIGLPWAATFVQRFNGYIDRFVEFVGYPGIDELPFDIQRTERFLTEQRTYCYDLALQMHGSGRNSNPFVLALGASTTIGYYEKMPAGLTIEAAYPDGQHEIYRNLNLVALLDHTFLDVSGPMYPRRRGNEHLHTRGVPTIPEVRSTQQHHIVGTPLVGVRGTGKGFDETLSHTKSDTRLEFPLFASDYAEADELLRPLERGRQRIIGIHPGARPPARRWPPEYFATVADRLAQRLDARILLTGGPGEEQTVQAVMAAMHTPAVSLVGRTSLGGLAALISHFDLFISNDTGPSHIACAVDCPSVTLFGPADVRRWAPLDRQRHLIVRHPVACSPCGCWTCPIDHRCLRWLSPDVVLRAATEMIQKENIQ